MSPFIRPAAVRPGDRMVARSVFLILLAFLTATMVTQPDVIDAEVEFQTVSSLARRQSFALGGTPEAEAIISVEHEGRQGFNVRRGGPGRESEFFSWYGVGQAYVGFPLYLLGASLSRIVPQFEARQRETTHLGFGRSEYFEHLAVGWRNPLLTALTAWLLVRSARRLGATRRSSWLAGLTYGLCTFAWAQGRSTLSGVQATFFLFLAFHAMLKLEEDFLRHRRALRLDLLLFGTALGGAFLTRALTAPAIAALACGAAWILFAGHRKHGQRVRLLDLGWMALPALSLFALFLWTNTRRFGNPLETGYGEVVQWRTYFVYPVHWGLLQILFAPGRGFVWMAPGSLLAFLWLRSLIKQGNYRMPVLIAAVAAAVLVPVSMTTSWHGAWTYGPRYALPLLPFLWVGVAPAFDLLEERRLARVGAAVLVLLGLVVVLPGVFVDHTTHTDLAIQAARIEWPDLPGTEADQEEERFMRIQRDFRFAAPWAHWRILRHRVAGLGEEFPVDEIFFLRGEAVVAPQHVREQGYLHLAWVDFQERLGGPTWPVYLGSLLALGLGIVLAVRGLDPDQA